VRLVRYVGLFGLAALVVALAAVPSVSATTIRVKWNERKSLERGYVAFRVREIAVGAGTWRVKAQVTNRSPSRLRITQPVQPGYCIVRDTGFGLCIPFGAGGWTRLGPSFATPAIPRTLPPGRTWRGTLNGFGTLPRGRYVHVGFGIFNPAGQDPFAWITDHGFRL
jgi:hypothetical protein